MISEKQLVKVNPNVSVDIVIFGFDFNELKVLLIERGLPTEAPERDTHHMYALPGDLIRDNENLDSAAKRVLQELTGLENIYLEQCHAFGNPTRLSRNNDLEWLKSMRADPYARVITVAYYSLVKLDNYQPTPSYFAKKADWYSINTIPTLAFDHNMILNRALQSLNNKARLQPIGFEMLPKKFTLSQLQKLYEVILNKDMDKRNFRRKVLNMGLVIALNEKQQGVPHKPALLYQFDKKKYQELLEQGFDLVI